MELLKGRTLSQFLALYYSRVFPFEDFHRWLTYDGNVPFNRREFIIDCGTEGCYEDENVADAAALKNKFRRMRPNKIEAGAVYTNTPGNFDSLPLEKEFVVDIDLANYKHIRTCCDGNSTSPVCFDCYELLILGMKIIDASLRWDHGFKHILWVYFGRHMYAWVCDERARVMPNSSRRELFYDLQKTKFLNKFQTEGRGYDPSLEQDRGISRALRLIQILWPRILRKQNMFECTDEKMATLMKILPNDIVREEIQQIFTTYHNQNSFFKYTKILRLFKAKTRSNELGWTANPNLLNEIILWYAYPRLNINVSISMCLPVIAPFSSQAETGEVAIPVTVDWAEDMNPLNVPTVERVLEDLSLAIQNNQDVHEQSCIQPFIRIFRQFLTELFNSNH